MRDLRKAKKIGYYIIGPSSRPRNQVEIINQIEGFHHRMDWAGMALELTKLNRGKVNDLLHIEKVDCIDHFKTWVDVYVEGFNIDSNLKQGIYENYGQHLVNEDPPVHFYLGFYEEQPAVSVALHYKDDIVGIYELATRPELRKKGLASSILQYLLEESSTQGYKWAVLQATEAGLSTYKKLGFETYCKFQVYLLKGR